MEKKVSKILYLHAGAEMYGADKVLLELVTNLDSTVFLPLVILPEDGPLVKELEKNDIEVRILDYPILRRKYFNIKGLVHYTIDYLKYSKKLLKIVKSNEIDLIHVNTTAVLEGVPLKIFSKAKMLWHVHEIILKPKVIFKVINFLIQRYSDITITVSDATKQHLLVSENGKSDNLKVIYNGVDSKVYNKECDVQYLIEEFSIPSGTTVIGMIGRINSWKGQNDFLDAVEPILKSNPQIRAFLVGGVFEGEERRLRALEQRIHSSEVSSQIILSDFRKDIANIHNLIDIFVLPSTNPDPLPTVVLEAMACAKPIVAYSHGGVVEMVVDQENGLLSEPRNIEKLTSNIKLLISDTNKRKEMGALSEDRQRELFDKNIYIENFEKQYIQMLGRD